MTDSEAAATRMERDSMGEMAVPVDALYGASTQRAVLNFPISGRRFPRRFLAALALVKLAAAETNAELGLLEPPVAEAIAAVAREVADGWGLHPTVIPNGVDAARFEAGARDVIVFSEAANVASEALYAAGGFQRLATHRRWERPA